MNLERIDAEATGKVATVIGPKLSDLQLLAEIKRLERSVASFGGAMLLAAYRADAERRGFKDV